MSRGRRARDAAGVSLFPFLAVLLCTMGALIVLLVILARRVEAQAREKYFAAVAEKSENDQERRRQAQRARQASLDQQTQELQSQADAAAAALKTKQETAARLQADLDDAQHRLQQLQEQHGDLERLTGQRPSDDQLRRQLADLDERLRQAQAILSDRQRAAAAPPQELYSIVPYAGRNGAARRPIYIECRGDRVICQPEGTELLAGDFEVLGPGNPLEAAVRTTVAHRDPSGHGDSNSYPLLLVRPDGVQAYHAARDALGTWGREFGYELVEQDWKLAYPPADAVLAQKQQAAVALGRQQMELLAKRQSTRRRSSPSFRISAAGSLERVGGGGGGGGGGGPGGDGDGPGGDGDGQGGRGTGPGWGGAGSGWAGAGPGSRGTGAGWGAGAGSGGTESGSGGTGPGSGGTAPAWGGTGPAWGGTGPASGGMGARSGSGTGGLASAGRPGESFGGPGGDGSGNAVGGAQQGSVFGRAGNGDPNDPLGLRFAQTQSQQVPFRQVGQPGGSANGGDPFGGGIGPGGDGTGSGPFGGGQVSGGPFGGGQLNGGGARGNGGSVGGGGGSGSGGGGSPYGDGQPPDGGPPGRRGGSSNPFGDVGSQLDRAAGIDRQTNGSAGGSSSGYPGGGDPGLAGTRGTRGSGVPGGQASSGGQAGFGGQGGSGGPGGPSSQPGPGGVGMGSSGMGSAGTGSPGMGGMPGFGAANMGMPTGGGMMSDAGGPAPDGAPEAPPSNWSFSSKSRMTPISKKEGANWALPSKPVRGSSPLRRDVHLMVDESAITVFVDPRTAQTLQIIRFGPDPAEVTGELKDAIWKVMKDWGNAPAGFHWRPVLRTQVTQRGAARFGQLETLLQDSGFELAAGQG